MSSLPNEMIPNDQSDSFQQTISPPRSSSCSWPPSLPVEIYREIKDWLDEKDYFRFLNTSQKYNQVKFMTRRIILSRKDVIEFVACEEFRERILSKISDPYYQLILVIRSFPESLSLAVLKDIKCSLWNRNEFSSPQEWYTLLEERESILCSSEQPFPENVTISNVKKLTLQYSLPAAIINISILTLIRCNLKDDLHFLHSCGQLAELNLQSCTGVKSLNGLDMIASSLLLLTLDSLDDLRDISLLSLLRLRECHVRNCDRIKDYGPLTSSGTRFIVLQPVGMRTLNYSNFHRSTRSLTPVDRNLLAIPVSFSSLHLLRLYSCDYLVNLSSTLYHIPCLEITLCPLVKDISGLGGHQSVTIIRCDKITDFSSLKNVSTVSISLCSGFTRGSDVENVKHLTIEYCPYFHDPSVLGKVHHLELRHLILNSFVGLYSVPVISLHDLNVVEGFTGLGGNQRIVVIQKEEDLEDLQRILFNLFPIDRYDREYLDNELIIYAKN